MLKKRTVEAAPGFRIVETGKYYVEEYEKWKKLRGDQPFRFTAKKIHGNPDYADPPDARNVDFSDRLRDAGPFQFDSYGRPINPLLPADASYVPEGRGVLGKWGPNTAEDKLVIGMSDAGSLQILLIERENPKDGWAIPGGMTERGEGQGATSTREFLEEAIDTEALTKQELATLTAYLDAQASLFYRGPMDDPRNTRNAWMFTRAYRVGAPPEIIKLMKLRPQKGEVRTVRWFDINDLDNVKFYANHAYLVARALETIKTEGRLHALAQEQSLSVKTRTQIGSVLQKLKEKY